LPARQGWQWQVERLGQIQDRSGSAAERGIRLGGLRQKIQQRDREGMHVGRQRISALISATLR